MPGRHGKGADIADGIALVLAVVFTAGLVARAEATVGPAGEWVQTGPPAPTTGASDALVTLPDGTAVLVEQQVQRYHPDTGIWKAAGSLLGSGGVPTLLPSGKVLVTGLSPAEIYDPAAEASTLAGAMVIPRAGHRATLLGSGDVLVSGGWDASSQLVGPAEVYHPSSDTWTLAGALNAPRMAHMAALLSTGKVLVAGGWGQSFSELVSAELYDPLTGAWTFTNPMSTTRPPTLGAPLPSGRILVTGGPRPTADGFMTQTYDPATAEWSPPVSVPGTGLSEAMVLKTSNDGRTVLVSEGLGFVCNDAVSANLYDANSDGWTAAVSSAVPMCIASGTFLSDGRMLVVGAIGFPNAFRPALLFRPDNTTARLTLAPASVDFGNVALGVPVQRAVIVQNTGEAHLAGSATLSNADTFSLVSGATYSLDGGASSPTVIGFSSSTGGTFTGTATFMSNGGWVSLPLRATVGIMLSGRITRTDGIGVPSISVQLQGTSSANATTDATGAYSFFVQPGTYTLTPSKPTLTFSPPTRSVSVSNANIAGLDFIASPDTPRLSNISTRGRVGRADDVMIGGFIVTGDTPMTVLVRAMGPSLASFGVPGVLANPFVRLFAGPTPIAENDDWQQTLPLCQESGYTCGRPADIVPTGLAPGDPFESAILITLPPGAYTAIVSGAGGTTGVGLVEIFEMGAPTSRLANVSTRGLVDVSDDVMIGGFIIDGSAPKTVVVRATGPSLANFGVPGVLSNPFLRIFTGGTAIAENDDWYSSLPLCQIQGYTCGGPSEIAAAGLAPAAPEESAIMITLPPGPYTAIVSGTDGGTGVGLFEVFEVQ